MATQILMNIALPYQELILLKEAQFSRFQPVTARAMVYWFLRVFLFISYQIIYAAASPQILLRN
jgi:hypothetical protein